MLDNVTKNPHSQISLFLAFSASVLAFLVIGLGAYTRLTDAGLGCPDWPGCYGQWILNPKTIVDPGFNTQKAWTEMLHRYMAGSLGILIFVLALQLIKNALKSKKIPLLPLLLVILLIFQALLGMWTVTLKLFPAVVMAHLLGGVSTLVLLWVCVLNALPPLGNSFEKNTATRLRRWGWLAFTATIVQLLLGGWTSANYAALVCLDFPFCQIPKDFHFDFFEAFRFSAGVVGSAGEPLSLNARISVQILHRIGALLVFILVGCFSLLTWRHTTNRLVRRLSFLTFSLLIIQILLGVSNVLLLLPLKIAVAHNGTAALLLLSLVTLLYYLNASIKFTLREKNV